MVLVPPCGAARSKRFPGDYRLARAKKSFLFCCRVSSFPPWFIILALPWASRCLLGWLTVVIFLVGGIATVREGRGGAASSPMTRAGKENRRSWAAKRHLSEITPCPYNVGCHPVSPAAAHVIPTPTSPHNTMPAAVLSPLAAAHVVSTLFIPARPIPSCPMPGALSGTIG